MTTLAHRTSHRLIRLTLGLSVGIRTRFDRLTAEPEAGIDSSTEKAIYIVGGVVLGLAVIGVVTAFVNGYLAKLP
jgi:hypothetical protein